MKDHQIPPEENMTDDGEFGFEAQQPEDDYADGFTDDLLDDAQELPALFPEDEPGDEPEEATVVERPERKKKSTARKVLRVFAVVGKWVLAAVLVVAVLAAGLIGYLTVTEYTPAYAENAQRGAVNLNLKASDSSLRIATFNTGYAGLGQDADFFLDGGESVNPDSQETVKENMRGIGEILRDLDADFILLQETDTDSDRTFHLNQWLQYEYDLADYESRFALNYSCPYVPYPLKERMGEIHSGISTYSRYDITSATRYSLPCPFKWPSRVANIKRCLLVTRIPLENNKDRELVLVNFHLEAYDDGEGKAAQTEQLLSLVQQEYEKGNYVIAGGDFNQSFPDARDLYPTKDTSEWEPGLLDDAPAGWTYAYDASVPTCRLLNQPYSPSSELTQYYVIDGFLVSPNVQVDRVQTLDEGFVYSDHNPVVLDFTLLQ